MADIEPTDAEVEQAARDMQWNGDAEWIRRLADHGDFGCFRVMTYARTLARLRIAVEALEGTERAIANGGLDSAMCCSGYECGCRGASHADLLTHDLREILAQLRSPDHG